MYVDVDLLNRADAVAHLVPGMSRSNVITMALEMSLPHMEAMFTAAKEAEPERQREVAMESLIRSLVSTFEEEDDE